MTGRTDHRKVESPLNVDFDAKTAEMEPSRGILCNSIGADVEIFGEDCFG